MAEKLIPLEDAQAIVLSHVSPTRVVEIPVWQAAGLPVAEDAVADIDSSPFANSAMDGYAVRAVDLGAATGDTPVTLSVVGHEAAGHVFEGTIGAGETVRTREDTCRLQGTTQNRNQPTGLTRLSRSIMLAL